MSMRPLELFHLKYLCRKCDIDPQEIDYSLTYDENKDHLLEIARRRRCQLYPFEENANAWFVAEADRYIDQLVNEVKEIIVNLRRVIKQAKFQIGRRILQDEEWLKHKYRDNYFGRLADKIDERGYSADQLRKCVVFAKLEEEEPEVFRRYMEDDSIGWEWIRCKGLLPENIWGISFIEPTPILWEGCGEVLHHLMEIRDIFNSKDRRVCKSTCNRYTTCSAIAKQLEGFQLPTVRQPQA